MAVPFRRTSKTKKRMRRTHLKKVAAGFINCPNCGAPIKNLGDKICSYCGSGVIDILKRTWVLNKIREF